MENRVFFYLAAHVLFTLLYYLCIRHKTRFQVWSECMVAAFIPYFGVLFLVALKIAQRLRQGKEQPDVYHQFQNDRKVLGGQMQTEVNIIPLNDALFIEELREKRALLTTAIKQNVLDNRKILRRALKDADREVSHYAVAMLTNQIETIEAEMFRLERQMEQEGESISLLRAYAAATRAYLDLHFLDRVSQRRKEAAYVELLERLLAAGAEDKAVYQELIERLLHCEDYARAEEICGQFAARNALDEAPYLCYIALYTEMRDTQKQQQKIAALKASPLQLTAKALEIIRFWDRGDAHAQ